MKNLGLFISTLNGGGAEHVVSRLSFILKDQYNVFVTLFEDTYMEYSYAGELINMDLPARGGAVKKGSLLFNRVRLLRRIKREKNLDCVISFLDSPNFVNVLSRVKGCKQIVSVRNYSAKENSNLGVFGRITNWAMGTLYKKADAIVPVSQMIAESLIAEYKLDPQKIHVIYNPYDTTEIRQLAKEETEPGFKTFIEDKFTFISVGRVQHQKGFWHLVKAFSIVHKKAPNARLVIVGEDFSDGQLESLIQQLGLIQDIYLTGRVKNPFQYMARSNAYVLTSLYEGFPNSMTEAMACGLPIIAADCKSGPREILCENPDLHKVLHEVQECEYGILVPELEDEEDWSPSISHGEQICAEQMLRLMENEGLRKKYAEKGTQRSAAFSYDICRDRYRALIDLQDRKQ